MAHKEDIVVKFEKIRGTTPSRRALIFQIGTLLTKFGDEAFTKKRIANEIERSTATIYNVLNTDFIPLRIIKTPKRVSRAQTYLVVNHKRLKRLLKMPELLNAQQELETQEQNTVHPSAVLDELESLKKRVASLEQRIDLWVNSQKGGSRE